jgi:TolB-like protein/Flp pilus assembly protein TadD
MPAGYSYEFGPFRLDTRGRLLFCRGERLALTPKAVEILIALVESGGSPVGRKELLQKVWADAVVEEGSLTTHISILRKTLGTGPGGQQYIETIPKRGYRFLGVVKDLTGVPAHFGPEKIMLAVLPFENLTSNKKHDYFSEGLTEEMITQLARLSPERLGVIARTSAMRYRSTNKSIREIGSELAVTLVLEGSVRRAGNRVRITAQLIQVSDATHVWAESYERNLVDILALQSDVAKAIAREIRVKLAPLEEELLASAPTVNPQAYEAYLKGRYLLNKRTLEALRESVRYFEKAMQHDSQYLAAYAGLADSYLTLLDVGCLPTKEATNKARKAAGKALRMDDTNAEAHSALGHAYFHIFSWLNAGREFRRAIELNHNCANAHYYYANYLVAVGRCGEAISEARFALALDPVSLPAGANLSSILYRAGRYEEAAVQALKVLELDSAFYRAHEDLGRAYQQQGDFQRAIGAFRKAVAFSGRDSSCLAELAQAFAVAGKRKEASKLLHELKQMSRKTYVSAYAVAEVFAGLGDKSHAFAWLEKAYEKRDGSLPFLTVNPRWAPLHSDPRFKKLLGRVGLSRKALPADT